MSRTFLLEIGSPTHIILFFLSSKNTWDVFGGTSFKLLISKLLSIHTGVTKLELLRTIYTSLTDIGLMINNKDMVSQVEESISAIKRCQSSILS
ncbi:TMEM165/GDT1 family protein [Bacteroides nordii]|nr:TMEM165/GDT1 family protein [Bacteroides nordii]